MRRNTLYTVNKWNKPAFMRDYNIFDGGGSFSFSNPFTKENIGGAAAQLGSQVGNIPTKDPRGAWDTMDPVYHLAGGRESGVGNALSDTGVTLAKSGNPWLMLAGAGLKVVGGLTNAAFGVKTDKDRVKAINQGLASMTNATSNAQSFDDIHTPVGLVNTSGVYKGGWFSGGKARKKQRALEEAALNARQYADNAVLNNVDNLYTDQLNDALANYSADGGKIHIDPSKKGTFTAAATRHGMGVQEFASKVLANKDDYSPEMVKKANFARNASKWHALGGPLGFGPGALGIMQNDKYIDAINNRSNAIAKNNVFSSPSYAPTNSSVYDAGGQLKASFLDSFGSDPIGAALRYNQGLEALEAQKEAQAAAEAKEAEYMAMQQKLANLETQNQGLQALMAAMPQAQMPEYSEPENMVSEQAVTADAFEAAPVSGKKADTWKYIEGQLKKSGKFNDIQIEGIKRNLQRESALNYNAVGDNGQAFGLGQWHKDRRPSDTSLAGQTKHLIETLSNFDGRKHWVGKGNYEGFLNARTPDEAHYYIAKGYERPASFITDKLRRERDMSLRNLRAFGGELGTNGSDWTSGLLYVDSGGTHEGNPLGGVPMGLDANGIPNLVEENETVFNDYVFSDRMKVPEAMYKELGLGGALNKNGISFAEASKKLAKESEQRPNDPISMAGLDASLARLAEVQEAERAKKEMKEIAGKHKCGGKLYKVGGGFKSSNNPYSTGNGKEVTWEGLGNNPKGITFDFPKDRYWGLEEPNTPIGGIGEDRIFEVDQYGNPIGPGNMPTPETPADANPEEYNRTYQTWMRYAPAFGAGLMTLTDMLGLTNKPDYTYANKIEAAANAAGYAPNIDYKPIGDYLRYSPFDRLFYSNKLQENARATDRAIMNSSSPSRNAALLANAYTTTNALGDLYRKGDEYNLDQLHKVAEFNRKTNMFNSQLDLEAAMANARYNQQAKQLGLSGLGQAAALRDAIDARVGAARSANITNLLNSLGNIGRENFALNQINHDKAWDYGATNTGVTEYKKTAARKNKNNKKK